MVKGTAGEKSPVRIGRAREDTCPHCGGRMVDMLVLDGRDERLKFLGLDGSGEIAPAWLEHLNQLIDRLDSEQEA